MNIIVKFLNTCFKNIIFIEYGGIHRHVEESSFSRGAGRDKCNPVGDNVANGCVGNRGGGVTTSYLP